MGRDNKQYLVLGEYPCTEEFYIPEGLSREDVKVLAICETPEEARTHYEELQEQGYTDLTIYKAYRVNI